MGFAARDDASKWRPESASLGTAPISRRRIFLKKKRKIDGFPSLILPKRCENVNADAPKWHRECETRRDEATLALSVFLAKKKYKKS